MFTQPKEVSAHGYNVAFWAETCPKGFRGLVAALRVHNCDISQKVSCSRYSKQKRVSAYESNYQFNSQPLGKATVNHWQTKGRGQLFSSVLIGDGRMFGSVSQIGMSEVGGLKCKLSYKAKWDADEGPNHFDRFPILLIGICDWIICPPNLG